MDWWTSLALAIALLWLLCFIDGHAVQELQLLFKALTKLAGNLYLVLLPLRRGVRHFTNCMIFCISHGEKPWPARRTIIVHFIEAICVLCELIPNLMCAALSLGEALCRSIQVGFYVLAAMLRTIQLNLNRR